MIVSHLIGGLGNNMFQYAIARIVADAKNYNLEINNISELQQYFPNVCNINDRLTVSDNILKIGYESHTGYVQHFDYNEVINHSGKIEFKGFFQKQEFYKEKINLLKTLFKYDDTHHLKPEPESLVIHIRLGDYKQLNWQLDPDIYIKIIEKANIKFSKCYVVTDEPTNEILSKFKIIPNVKIINSNVLQDLTLLRHAAYLIISQSTFSWWGAVLGEQQKVFAPVHYNYRPLWSNTPKIDDVDLIFANKFIKVLI